MRLLNNITAEISGWFVLLIAIIMMVGFTGRSIERPVMWVSEFAQFALVLIIFFGFAICEEKNTHVRIEVLISRFPTRLWQAANIFTYLVALIAIALVVWGGLIEAIYSLTHKEVASGLVLLPLFPPKFAIVVGALLYFIQLLISTVRESKHPSLKPTVEVAPPKVGRIEAE